MPTAPHARVTHVSRVDPPPRPTWLSASPGAPASRRASHGQRPIHRPAPPRWRSSASPTPTSRGSSPG